MKKIIVGMIVMILALTSFSIDAGDMKSSYYYFYYNDYDTNQSWSNNPGYMVDGDNSSYASTDISLGEVELLTGNNCNLSGVNITCVELRANAYSGPSRVREQIILTPVFNGTSDGDNYSDEVSAGSSLVWTQWFDITNDSSGPGSGNWKVSDVENLDCKVTVVVTQGNVTMYCSYVQIRVTVE